MGRDNDIGAGFNQVSRGFHIGIPVEFQVHLHQPDIDIGDSMRNQAVERPDGFLLAGVPEGLR